MKCSNCGYCCKYYMVVIVDNPELGIVKGNFIANEGNGCPCKHLVGDKPGEYSCAVHDYPWFQETPCHDFAQIEEGNQPCRTGVFMMKYWRDKGEEFGHGLDMGGSLYEEAG